MLGFYLSIIAYDNAPVCYLNGFVESNEGSDSQYWGTHLSSVLQNKRY